MRFAMPVIGVLFISAVLGGCSASGAPAAQDRDPYLAMNKALLTSGCSSCHAADYARLGPAMTDIAAQYRQATAEERMAVSQNIVAGVKGKWGTSVMPPQHQITPQRADEILNIILSLDTDGKR